MTLQNVPLSKIHSNPWQTRTEEDPEVVQRVGNSISSEGLLQIPIGRPSPGLPGHVQLAFGHTRLAAHEWLGRESMPVEVRELADRQMAELAIRENRDRSDLSPIEEARAMFAYQRDFGATTDEVAALWGLEASTIRSKLRLLRLPEAVQAHVHAGRLPERTARQIAPVARIDAGKAAELADVLAASDNLDPEQVSQEIRSRMDKLSRKIADPWDDGRAGRGWWKLDQAFAPGAEVRKEELAEALADLFEGDRKQAGAAGEGVLAWLEAPEGVGLASDIPEEAVERVRHLVSPPACTACPFHAEVGGMHYCSFDPCWTVKKRAWIAQDLARVQRKKALKGIARYDRKDDGPKAAGDYSGDTIRTKIRKALEARQLTDLRLAVSSSPAYTEHDHTGSPFVQVVLVGKGAVQAKKRREAPYDWEKENEVRRRREAEIERVQQAAAPHFAALFAGFKDWILVERLLRLLARDEGPRGRRTKLFPDDNPRAQKATRLAAARRHLGRAWVELYSPWGLRGQGGKALVKHLQGVARTFGVKLPKGWADEALSVAADTVEEETQ
jgi:ParB/RepB/Spo0J family partition protein